MRTLRSPSRLVAVVAALAVLAAACGDADPAAPDVDPAEAEGTVRVVITWTGSEFDAFSAVIDGFTDAHPDVDVDIVQIPFGELNAQLTQQFAAGSPPDVTVVLPGLIRLFAGQGFLAPVDDLWDAWVSDGQYTDDLRDIASFEDSAYGVWFKGNVNGLIWYSPETLADLGLEVPETWDEFEAVLDAVAADGQEPFAVGAADTWVPTQWWDPFLVRVGGAEAFNGLVDGTVSWDDPRVVESFEVFADFIERYFPADALDRGFVEATCARVDGRAAFQNQGAFVNLVARGECDPDLVPVDDYTFFHMPRYRDDAPELVDARASLESMRGLLKREVDQALKLAQAKVQGIRSRIETIERQIPGLQAELAEMPSKEARLADLDQDLTILKARFLGLTQDSDRARVTEQTSRRVSVVVLSPASPGEPRKTHDYVRLALAPAFSLVIGIGLAFFIDGLDSRLRTARDVEDSLDLPVLASLTERKS